MVSELWNYQVPQTLYSSVHWLAYFDDHQSIEIILKEIELGSLKTFLNFNNVEFQQLTPIDIAGLNKC